MRLPGLFRHLQELHAVVVLNLLEVVAQPQLVVQGLHLGIEILILVLGCVLRELH